MADLFRSCGLEVREQLTCYSHHSRYDADEKKCRQETDSKRCHRKYPSATSRCFRLPSSCASQIIGNDGNRRREWCPGSCRPSECTCEWRKSFDFVGNRPCLRNFGSGTER